MTAALAPSQDEWLRKGAEEGDAEAQYDLGMMYYAGRGVPKDYAEAIRWFRKAADQGNAKAQISLADMYSSGDGTPKDDAEAAEWYLKAAKQGDSNAQSMLGSLYAQGTGLKHDYAEALKWIRKAADQGHSTAEYNLGVMYAKGQGAPQNYVEAMRWYRKAADLGNEDAKSKYADLNARFPALKGRLNDRTSATAAAGNDRQGPQNQISSLFEYTKHIKHRWTKHYQDREGTHYIDQASIVRTGDTLTVLYMLDYERPQKIMTEKGEYFGSSLSLVRYDCGSTPRSMFLAFVFFHGNMGSGTPLEGSDGIIKEPPDGWYVMPARDNSGMLQARDMACDAGKTAVTPAQFGTTPTARMPVQTAPKADATMVPIESDAVIYDEFKGNTKLMNGLVTLVKAYDYRCDAISALTPFILAHGFALSCNRFRYKYEIEDKGGHWVVSVK